MDTIVLDGDMVTFETLFAPAVVMVRPGKITGSGEKVNNRRMCIEVDAQNVVVAGCPYTSGPYTIPGTGTLKIEQLNPMSVARKTKSLGQAVILKGLPGLAFTARFYVQAPAMMTIPTGTMPDPQVLYTGRGSFSCMPPFAQGE